MITLYLILAGISLGIMIKVNIRLTFYIMMLICYVLFFYYAMETGKGNSISFLDSEDHLAWWQDWIIPVFAVVTNILLDTKGGKSIVKYFESQS